MIHIPLITYIRSYRIYGKGKSGCKSQFFSLHNTIRVLEILKVISCSFHVIDLLVIIIIIIIQASGNKSG